MIGRLRGTLVYKQSPILLLDVQGVGYELEVPVRLFSGLPEIGTELTLHTHLIIREDANLLYAFSTLQDRDLFRELLKVNGVGPRLALNILSGMEASIFARCIGASDLQSLTKLPGLGKKTAERLLIEMRERVRTWETAPQTLVIQPIEDAIRGLISLGYPPQEASRLVQSVEEKSLSTEDLIRQALKSTLRAGGRLPG